MQPLYKMLHRTKLDMRLLDFIGVRAFVHIETLTKKLKCKAVGGRLVGYSINSKIYFIYNPAIRRIMKNRNVTFIETISRLLPPPSEQSLIQSSGRRQVGSKKGYNYGISRTTAFLAVFVMSRQWWNSPQVFPPITSPQAGS